MLVDEDEKTPKEMDAEIKRRKERQVGFNFVSKFKLNIWSRKKKRYISTQFILFPLKVNS